MNLLSFLRWRSASRGLCLVAFSGWMSVGAQAQTAPLVSGEGAAGTIAVAVTAPVVGQLLQLPPALQDQHGQPWAMAADTRLLLFASGRKAANLMEAALQDLPADHLSQHGAMYLADLSKMPGFITRTFALPAMRKLSYRIGLVNDESLLSAWPRAKPDAVQLITLRQGVVQQLDDVHTVADIQAAIAR